MSLNIKNPRVHELARRAASQTGTSQTAVIERALELLLEQLDRPTAQQERRRRLDLLFGQLQAEVSDSDRAAMQQAIDEMYDENGLPA